jgi:threonine dehydratase
VTEISLEDIIEAHARIAGRIHRTPVLTSARLDELTGTRLFFKCENFQKTGSFKARGAANAVFSLADADAARGVATHSSGNHGAALAWAARQRGIPAFVAMPRTASQVKLASVRRLGGTVVLCEPTHKAREEAAERIVMETGAAFIHPFDNPRVIAGQGTAALELFGDVADLDAVVCPVGGGGLLAGTAVAARALRPAIRVFAGEPEGAADASQSFASGVRRAVEQPASIADGLLAFVGDLTFPIIRSHADGIATVPDRAIADAMRQIWEVMKIVVEPSGAVGFAAVAEGRLKLAGLRVGVILSGGNVEFGRPAGPQ